MFFLWQTPYRFVAGDHILYLNRAYGMVKRVLEFLRDTADVKLVEVPVKFPFTNDGLLKQIEDVLQ